MILVLHCTRSAQRRVRQEIVPSATPQRYSLPLTTLPSGVVTSSVLPMMENGITDCIDRACSAADSSSVSIGGVYTLMFCAATTSRNYISSSDGLIDLGEAEGAYSVLKRLKILWGHCIGLRDDRYQVDASSETLHDLHVKRFQSISTEASAPLAHLGLTCTSLS